MLLHILRKDLQKRKGVNTILFVFITMATVFLASSVNNILVTTTAIDYYVEYANIPDVNVILTSEKEKADMDAWLQIQKEEKKITKYAYSSFLSLPEKDIVKVKDTIETPFNTNEDAMYISGMHTEYNKIYDEEGESFTLAKDEIAISRNALVRNDLKIGDTLRVRLNNEIIDFTIKVVMKDAAFGSDLLGVLRLTINQNQYEEISENASKLGMFYIDSEDPSSVLSAINEQAYTTLLNIVNKDMYALVYAFDIVMAGLLILIGICMILIALLVLRFTLVFTLEEQFQEIGILKAIGLRSWSIKKIYLIKYFVLVSVGALLGVWISIPVSDVMVQSVSKNLLMERGNAYFGYNLLCAICIVIFVLLFCFLCTKKMGTISPISAIRSGSGKERYHKKLGIALAKCQRMSVSVYLGMNDILSNLKRYTILIITFCISFILITIPLNTVNTMKSSEMLEGFMIDPNSTILVNSIELKSEGEYQSITELKTGMNRLKKELKEEGYEPDLTSIAMFFYGVSLKDTSKSSQLLTIQLIGDNTDYLPYSEGVAPILENEIAISEAIMQENKWVIGDIVELQINGSKQEFIITGTYSDYAQIGRSARLNPVVDCSKDSMIDYTTIMVTFDTDRSENEVKSTMVNTFPDYEWSTGSEFVYNDIGSIQEMVDAMLVPMTALLCAVIMLITLLMERLFITREKGEIAMMKCMGFSTSSIQKWQLVRMIMVVLTSMLIAIPLSLVSNQYLLKPIFKIMGANMTIHVKALEVYVIYPGILLFGILIATIFATRYIRKINIHEMNNLE